MKFKRRDKRYNQSLLARLATFAYGSPAVTTAFKRILSDVIDGVAISSIGDARHEIDTWSLSSVAAVQAQLRQFFEDLMSHITSEGGDRVPELAVDRLEFGVTPIGRGGHVVMSVDGGARDVLLFQVIQLLHLAGVERLRRCECGAMFAKTGRREYLLGPLSETVLYA